MNSRCIVTLPMTTTLITTEATSAPSTTANNAPSTVVGIQEDSGGGLRMESMKSSPSGVKVVEATSEVITGGNARSRNQRDAKKRILRQTLVIVVTFLVCWSPYVFITLWYQIDSDSAQRLNDSVTGVLFLFAVSNSVINPFIYGKFVKDNPQRVWKRIIMKYYDGDLRFLRHYYSWLQSSSFLSRWMIYFDS